MTTEADAPATGMRIAVDEDSYRAWLGAHELRLTALRFNLLALLVRNAGLVVGRRAIVRQVWGHDRASTKTVDMNILYLRRQLAELSPDTTYIRTVRGLGWTISKEHVAPCPPLDIPSLGEEPPSGLVIQYDSRSTPVMRLGGMNIAPLVRDVSIRVRPGQPPSVAVTIAPDAIEGLRYSEPDIRTHPEIHALLKELGWTPPPTDAEQ